MKRIIFTAFLLVITLCIRAQSNATQVEYFLDTDNGFGLNTVLNITSPDTDITELVTANIPMGTSLGYHKLYMRVKDADGNWSQTVRKHIEIVPPFAQNNIVMGEYFLDQDPQFGTATSFAINPEQEDIEQAFTAQIAGSTTLGYHKLYGRVKDSKERWSHTFRKNIEVYLNPITNVVEIEYFFDNDLGFGTKSIETIGTPEADGTWTFNVPYPAGSYDFNDILFVRVKDSNQNWSITTVLDEVASLGTESFLQKSTSVYPNPFNQNINLITPNSSEINNIRVYNALGSEVYESSLFLNNINLEFLSPGLYFLQLSTKTSQALFKIIKK